MGVGEWLGLGLGLDPGLALGFGVGDGIGVGTLYVGNCTDTLPVDPEVAPGAPMT